MDADRLRRAIDQLIYLPSLRQGSSAGPSPALAAVAAAAKERQRRQGGGGGGAGGAAGSDPVPPPPRPWDREGLFRRAATFKPSTWFAKDAETAGPLRAAARGWTNVGVDLLRCEFCGEKLAATTSTTTATATTATGGSENDNNENNEKTSFPARLVSCHAAECPWRTGPACDLESLAQFPPLTREAAQAEFVAREASALALDALPPLSRASYDFPASVAKGRLEALLQLGPRPEGGEDEEEAEVEDAPEPPVLLLAAAPEGEGDGSSASTSPLVARRGSRLHLRMARLVALFGWSAEIVAPAVARRALEELAAAERRRMKAAVEEAAARRSRKERGGGNGGGSAGGDDAASATTDNDDELPVLWPPRALPAHPPASAMPAGSTVRACDTALRCEACGATAGLWSFVPSELCGGGGGGGGSEGEEKGGGAAATGADSGNGNDSTTPPAAKRARRGGDPSLPLSGWSPSPPGKVSTATPGGGGGGGALRSRPGELDLISLHRPWCPFVDSLPLPGGEKGEKGKNRRRRRRVGWRWTLAALVPAVAGDDEAGEGDARLLGLEEDDGEEEEEGNEGGGAKKAGVATAANAANAVAATASSPPSSERATDRLRAVLARAGIVSPAAATTAPPPPPSSRSLVN